MFTFPVLNRENICHFLDEAAKEHNCGFFQHAKTYTFIKICDVLVKTFDYKSKNQISGSVLWILDKLLCLFGLDLRFLI